MNALMRKEIRLLLPFWIVAILHLILPAILAQAGATRNIAGLLSAGVVLSFVIALGTFGREFSNGTFSSLLALSIPRSRVWWTKVLILAFALLSIYGVWWISFSICAARWPGLRTNALDGGVTPLTSGLLLLTAFSGGLWTTLLFRQLAAAVWFAILIPIALLMGAGAIVERFTSEPGHLQVVSSIVMLLYGIGGFLWAWRLFMRAEDAQWTGGVVALPRLEIPFKRTGANSILRTPRPIAALLRKEFQLHHASLLIAGLLFFLHLGIIALRTYGGEFTKQPIITDLLAVFWGLWLIMPLLIGATAVAEERKLGVAEGQLCQPIGWRRQLIVKLFVVLGLGVLLGAVPSWTLERGRQLPNFFSTESSWEPVGALVTLPLLSAFIAVVAFYASTLARNTLQALGIAVVLFALGGISLSVLARPELWLGSVFWRGDLGEIIGWPVMLLVGARLLWGNFRLPHVAWREWKRNLAVLALAALFVVTSASMIYHRAWEFLTRIETPHGAARIALAEPFAMQHDGGLSLLAPDGSLNVFRYSFAVRPRSGWIWRNYAIGSIAEWTRQSLGTNWRTAAAGAFDTVAIRDDGSLWASEAPSPRKIRSFEPPPPLVDLEQIGVETNWRQVVRDPREGRSFYLLKTDGTLWRLRDTNRTPRLPLAQIEPRQAGADPDWAKLWPAGPRLYLTKSAGRAWGINTMFRSSARNASELETGVPLEPVSDFEGVEWRSVAGLSMFDLRVRPDGSLWAIGILPWMRRQPADQLDESFDWKTVAGSHQSAIALKEDGSLWKIDLGDWNTRPFVKRLSQYSDWVAVASSYDQHFALAADGSIWSWEAQTPYLNYQTASFKLPIIELAPSRIPRRIGSLF